MPTPPGSFKRFPDRYDIERLVIRRGDLTPPEETVYRALSDLQDLFTLAGQDEESRTMQTVVEDFCERWGGMYGEGFGHGRLDSKCIPQAGILLGNLQR